jgi:hypothetical protein
VYECDVYSVTKAERQMDVGNDEVDMGVMICANERGNVVALLTHARGVVEGGIRMQAVVQLSHPSQKNTGAMALALDLILRCDGDCDLASRELARRFALSVVVTGGARDEREARSGRLGELEKLVTKEETRDA